MGPVGDAVVDTAERTMSGSLAVAVCTGEKVLGFDYANEAFSKLFLPKHPPRELRGPAAREFFREHAGCFVDPEGVMGRWAAAAEGPVSSQSFSIVLTDGRSVECDYARVWAAGAVTHIWVCRQLPAPWSRALDVDSTGAIGRAVLHAALDCIVVVDASGIICECNPLGEIMLGWEPGEILGRKLADTIVPEAFRRQHKQGWERYLQTGERRAVGKRLTMSAARKDGTTFPVELQIQPIETRRGEFFAGYLRSLESEQLARRTLEETARFPDENPHPVMRVAEDGTLLFANRNSSPLLEAWQVSVGERVPCSVGEHIARARRDGLTRGHVEHRERVTDLHFVHIPEFGYCNVYGQDVTARATSERNLRAAMDARSSELERTLAEFRKLENEMQNVGKLTVLGQLAAGIAHEINTPSQYLGDSLEFLKTAVGALLCPAGVDDNDLAFYRNEIPGALERALDGLGRIREIVHGMRNLSHPGGLEAMTVSVLDCVHSAEVVARGALREVSTIRIDIPQELRIRCHPEKVQQVIIACLMNAADAIRERGEGFDGWVEVSAARTSDAMVRITVSDNGVGMSPETCESALIPFFTTKSVGQGTGQGLAIARSIVEDQHGGQLRIDSEPGCGTTVEIVLPEVP
jgi:PAS domain S-box-containing protein